MSHYLRFKVRGASYFFTVNLAGPGRAVLTDHVDLLRLCWLVTLREQPFRCEAVVVLPDHLHAVWTLPPGDADFSNRWRKIKARFSHALGQRFATSQSKVIKREVGLWQRRFWEHCLRDEDECRRAVDFCHRDPVRHGLAKAPEDWAHSLIHRSPRLRDEAYTA